MKSQRWRCLSARTVAQCWIWRAQQSTVTFAARIFWMSGIFQKSSAAIPDFQKSSSASGDFLDARDFSKKLNCHPGAQVPCGMFQKSSSANGDFLDVRDFSKKLSCHSGFSKKLKCQLRFCRSTSVDDRHSEIDQMILPMPPDSSEVSLGDFGVTFPKALLQQRSETDEQRTA